MKPAPICKEWFYDFVTVKSFGILIAVGINAINFILKITIINLVEFIKYDTKSRQMSAIKIGVFMT